MSFRYRADIDGLRAIAVIAIVAFHVGLPWSSGGFVGVDVFFVISGFLIAGLLVDEIGKTRSIDLPSFYARRVRRLLPALYLVVTVTLVAGFFLLNPLDNPRGLANSRSELDEYRRSAVSVIHTVAREFNEVHVWDPVRIFMTSASVVLLWTRELLTPTTITSRRRRPDPFYPMLFRN